MLLVTFGLTVFVDLVVAVNVGVVIAALLFMRRMAESVSVQQEMFGGPEATGEAGEPALALPPKVLVYRIDGPFFFGAAEKLESTVERAQLHVETVVIRLGKVPFMDATGMHTLSEIIERFQRRGIRVLLVEIREQLARTLARAGLLELAGPDNVYPDLAAALGALSGSAIDAPGPGPGPLAAIERRSFGGRQHLDLRAKAEELPRRIRRVLDRYFGLYPPGRVACDVPAVGRFGRSRAHLAQDVKPLRRQPHSRATCEQPRLEVTCRLGPIAAEVEACRSAELRLQHVEPADVRHAVGARSITDRSHEVPDARLEHEAERIDVARHAAFPALVLDPHAQVVPGGRREPRQDLGCLGTRIPVQRIEVKSRSDPLGASA